MTQASGRTDSPGLTAPRPGAGALHVPGPVDRVHFLDEQQRYRKASRRFTLLAFLAVLITGIPACIVVTPLVFTILMTIGHIVNAIAPVSPEVWKGLQSVAFAIPDAANSIDADTGRVADVARAVFGISFLVLPGALALLLLWLWIRRLLGHVAVGHALERAAARPPNERDLEERQLGNVVEEMAVAAGVKPPRVLIVETDAVNAAAMGTDVDDATVLVTRGLLDKLDRDETQAVIAHVVGSVGNGDLRIASIIFSIYQTWGALTLLMNAPFGATSRGVVWRAVRTALRGRARAVDRWEAEFVSEAFLHGAIDGLDPDIERRMQGKRTGLAGKWDAFVNLVSLPMQLAAWVVQFAVFISSVALIGPIVSFMWRTRRHLADAMAVQLTRNPDALARALRHLAAERAVVPQGDDLSLLFMVWPSTTAGKKAVVGQFTRMHPKLHQRERRLLALGADPTGTHAPAGLGSAVGELRFRFRSMPWTPTALFFAFLWFVVIPVLLAVALVLSVTVLVMVTMLTLMVMMVMMLVISVVLNFLFITLPGWIARR